MSSNLPLSGKRIVLTRDSEGNARLGGPLAALGAEIVELPLIEVKPTGERAELAEALREFASYEWLVFTSRNGVKYFLDTFLKAFTDIRSLGFVRIAVIGDGTAEALGEFFLKPDLQAPEATAASLAAALAEEQTLDNLKILVITGNRNSDDLVKRLGEERAIVDAVAVYQTTLKDLSEDPVAQRLRELGADAIVFASGSAVQAFGEQAKHLQLAAKARRPVLCSIGKTTTERMRAYKIPVTVEAEDPGIDGIVAALVRHFSAQ